MDDFVVIGMPDDYLASGRWHRETTKELREIRKGLEESRDDLLTLGKTPESDPERFDKVDRVFGACDRIEAHLCLTKMGMDFEEGIAGVSGREVKDVECPECGFEWAESHARFSMVDIVCPLCKEEKEAELW